MRIFFFCFFVLPFFVVSQNIDHWETVVFDNDIWKNLIENAKNEIKNYDLRISGYDSINLLSQ